MVNEPGEAVRVYLGLGSNLQTPHAQLQRALQALASIPDTRLLDCSPLYRSAPMGPQDQPDYLNAVAMLDTRLSPEDLLDALQAIENRQGRERKQRWGARTLDLDILLYGQQQINTPRLVVPHPGMAERNFVLYPLADLNPELHIPGLGKLADLRKACPKAGLERLADSADASASVLS